MIQDPRVDPKLEAAIQTIECRTQLNEMNDKDDLNAAWKYVKMLAESYHHVLWNLKCEEHRHQETVEFNRGRGPAGSHGY